MTQEKIQSAIKNTLIGETLTITHADATITGIVVDVEFYVECLDGFNYYNRVIAHLQTSEGKIHKTFVY